MPLGESLHTQLDTTCMRARMLATAQTTALRPGGRRTDVALARRAGARACTGRRRSA
jgi:hypothetical protein